MLTMRSSKHDGGKKGLYMKAKFGKKYFRQLQGATHGRIGKRRGVLMSPLKTRNARRQVPQARRVANAI